MRFGKTAFSVATAVALFSFPAFAQQAPGTMGDPTGSPPAVTAPPSPTVPITGAAPSEGTAWLPGTTTGLDKVGDDGVSTKTVKAIPCGAAAKETDGATTCVGIPDERASAGKTR
jgi:hypothetical protein